MGVRDGAVPEIPLGEPGLQRTRTSFKDLVYGKTGDLVGIVEDHDFPLTDVDGVTVNATASLPGGILGSAGVRMVVEDDISPFARTSDGERAADALRGTGYEDDFVAETHGGRSRSSE